MCVDALAKANNSLDLAMKYATKIKSPRSAFRYLASALDENMGSAGKDVIYRVLDELGVYYDKSTEDCLGAIMDKARQDVCLLQVGKF